MKKVKDPWGHVYKLSKKGWGNSPVYYCPICKHWIHVKEHNLMKKYYE
jgi:hypothetical protein